MIINLSSNGETNHANFTNRFSDNIIIKPNSTVCLTRISLVREATQTKIIIPAGLTMSFRFTPYDISTQIINVVETTYTPELLKNRLNAMFGGFLAYNYEFLARVEIVNDDVEIEFTSYINYNKWQATKIRTFLFGDENTRNVNRKSILLTNGTTLPEGTIDADDELRGVLFTGGAGAKGFCPYWGNGNLKIDNQVNGGAYNLLCYGPVNYGGSNICIVNPTLTTKQVIRLGSCYFDNALDQYNLAPVPGNVHANTYSYEVSFGPSGNANNRNGKAVVSLRDNGTNTLGEVGTVYNWFCGDTVLFNPQSVVAPTGTEEPGQLFTINTKIHGRKGLIGYLPSQLSGTKYWNVEEPVYTTPYDYWERYGNDPINLAAYFDGETIYGSRLGRGIKSTQIQQVQVQYKLYASVGTTTVMTYNAQPVGTRSVGNFPFYRTWNAGGATDDGNLCCYNIIEPNGLPSGVCPTFISFIFQLEDKTGYTAQTERTLFAGATNSGMRIDLGAVSGWDVEFFEIDSTAHNSVLQDAGAAPIAWNYTSNYLFQMKTYGSGVDNSWNISVTDLVSGVAYLANGTMTGGGLEPIVTLAGDPSNVNNEYFLHGYLGEFRFYQKPATNDGDILYWDELALNLKNFYNGTGGDNTIVDGYGGTIYSELYTAGENKYGNWGTLDPQITMCPTITRPGDGAAFDANWYNMTDLWCFPCPTMPFASRDILSTNVYGYANRGQGIVNSNPLNDILDIKDYNETEQRILDFQSTVNPPNSADDPIFSTTSETESVEIEDKIFNIQIKNLPHRNFNGAISNYDKTIYQIGSMVSSAVVGDKKIIEIYPPVKVVTQLENAGDLVLNQIEVMITDELNKVETDLKINTNLTIEIL
tara:strand:+ start:1802 stop:4411 length:2610 start_codon:yes stop_codon:yes gene_type:complete